MTLLQLVETTVTVHVGAKC